MDQGAQASLWPPRGRLGFAVMVGPDGDLPEALLHDLKAAGYTGIEPNCYQPRHLPAIIERCRNVGLAIHALPTGRWLQLDQARADYDRYTQRALDVLREGAAIAVALDAPLILGLIRGTAAISAAESEALLVAVIRSLVQTTPQLKILVEPIAADEAAWPHTLDQGAALLERLNLPNVKLLADSYHIVRSGQDWHAEQHRPMIDHLHIRDHAKHIPTDSTPEYAAVYAAILRLWREEHLVLSFEPDIDLRGTLEAARAGMARSHSFALTIHRHVYVIHSRARSMRRRVYVRHSRARSIIIDGYCIIMRARSIIIDGYCIIMRCNTMHTRV